MRGAKVIAFQQFFRVLLIKSVVDKRRKKI